jgi:CSLREA domain-containing protein/uncharacterized repeat protein (TIGR01451 family)
MLFGRVRMAWGIATVVALAATGTASAATFTVTKTADVNDHACTATVCSLRDAVIAADTASGSSTIIVPAGHYKLAIASTRADDPTTGDLDIDDSASVTIRGAGSGSTIIDGNNVDRLFSVDSGASLTLSGMTLRGGTPAAPSSGTQFGGAIWTDGGLTIGDFATGASGDVVFEDNEGFADDGGAIYAGASSTVSLTGATFQNNACYQGCAIADISNNQMSISHSRFEANLSYSEQGGAIYGDGDAGLTVDSSTFSANTAGDGGAIFWNSTGALTIGGSTFDANDTTSTGGAIDVEAGGPLSIRNSTFDANVSSDGGAIYEDADQAVSITGSTFEDNYAAGEGGGVYDDKSSGITADDDAFIDNSAPDDGGGAMRLDSTNAVSYTLNHDLFQGNTATDDYGGAVSWFTGSLTSIGSSYVDDTAGYSGGALYGDSGHSLTLINDTVSHDAGGPSLNAGGGAIYLDVSTPASLINDTITDNVQDADRVGGIEGVADLTTTGYSGSGTAGIQNTVIAGNTGGDCDVKFSSSFDLGHNMDGDGSCFGGPVVASDLPEKDPDLGNPADNGGVLAGNPTDGSAQTIPTGAEKPGGPTVNAGSDTHCPATDARGVPRPQGSACDIGAFELAGASLAVGLSAPSDATAGSVFQYTAKVTNHGPGFSSATTLVDRLPAGATLWSAKASQGSCAASGSPANVVCVLGDLSSGKSATVTLAVSEGRGGSVSDTASATNAQGASSRSTPATVKISAPATGYKPKATTGTAAVSAHRASLSGQVNPGGQRTSYFFQYEPAGGSSWSVSAIGQTGTSVANVTESVGQLQKGTKYQYRLVATNDSGTAYGAMKSFRPG